MKIKTIKIENFTVFSELTLKFGRGIHVFIGENATGKTHLMKLLYAACRSNRVDVGFGEKIVRTMMPDGFQLGRLVSRNAGNQRSYVRVSAVDDAVGAEHTLSVAFDRKTKKWEGEIRGKEGWENAFSKDTSVFIPAKEILSDSYNLPAATSMGNVRFDDTYIDVIHAAKINITGGKPSENRNVMLRQIEKITNGQIVYNAEKDEFYLKQGNVRQEFQLVAEGIKKMGLLWILAKNGTLEPGSVLFWDEPEANINPSNLSAVAELLLELQRNGVQIFLSTHNYFLAKYIDIRKTSLDEVCYYSLFRDSDGDGVHCESCDEFTLLENNPITKTFLQIYRDEIGVKL